MSQPPYPQQPPPPGYYVPPPPPQGMSAGKIILIVVGVIMAMLFGTCVVCTMVVGAGASAVEDKRQEREQQEAEAKVQLEKDLEKCSASETVEWAALLVALKDNEAKIAAAWKNSCAKVSGVVDGVDSGFDDKPFVLISDGSKFSLQKLHCKPVDEKKALELSKGQPITVWGVGGSEVIGSLVLEHCDW